jgi:peptide/nickel transport system substrate-binding protein
MKANRFFRESFSGKILPVVLVVLFTLCAWPAHSASEPGTVTLVLSAEPVDLDPSQTARGIEGQVIMRNILETLTEINPADSSMMPRLATSWKQIDTNTWHFFLRKGVKFHDGRDFNAEAVLFNFDRIRDKRVKGDTVTKFFSDFKMEGKAMDSSTLEIKTDRFQPLLPNLLGLLGICSPNTSSDKFIRNPVGTGPYRLGKWDAGMQIVLERFDGYWGKPPQVKKAVYLWRGESSVRAAMVAIGEADLAPDIANQDANRPELDYSYLNSETTFHRIGGVWEPPLNDKRVRMALNYAVNRDAIRGSIFSKDVVPASHLVVPSTFGYNPEIKPWPYDPKKARQLLDEARKDGVPVDKEISLATRAGYFTGEDEIMEALMTMYKAVGFNVRIRKMDPGVFRPYVNKPFPTNIGPYLAQKSHDNNKGDAVFTVFFNYHCKGSAGSMCDKQTDELIEKAQVATGEERRKLWQATFKRIYEEIVPDVVLFHLVGYCRVGKRITYKPNLATSGEIQLAQITFR